MDLDPTHIHIFYNSPTQPSGSDREASFDQHTALLFSSSNQKRKKIAKTTVHRSHIHYQYLKHLSQSLNPTWESGARHVKNITLSLESSTFLLASCQLFFFP